MDSLAQRGMRFTQAYCTQPLCTPSRASLFTGFMPHEVGVQRNGLAITDTMVGQGIGHLLSRAGYDCGYGGKWHVPEASLPEGHGFERVAPFGDDGLTDACVAFLQRPRERPFFLVASYDNPHNICEWARRQPLPWGRVADPASLADCPNLPANFAPPSFEPEIIRIEQDANRQLYPAVSFTEDDWRRYRYAYCRLVEKVDAQVGRLLEALDRNGLCDSTVVVFTSDHGDGNGAHRWNQKSVLYEDVIRVPLLIAAPGNLLSDAQCASLVSTGLDVYPTLCAYAGVTPPPGRAGYPLQPLIEGTNRPSWRDELVVQTFFDGGRGYNTVGRMLRTLRYKYVVYHMGRHREQLFDLEQDPGEMVNLAVEQRHAGVLAEHRRRLAAWCEQISDPFRKHLVDHI